VSIRPRTILIVDDDEAAREALGAPLRRDYRLLRATSGEAALAILVREEVDVALVDVEQPGISGFEMLRILRENYPAVEVIMISAAGHVDDAVRAVKDGAFHFVTKDADPEAVRSLVQHALERQALNREVLRLRTEVDESTDREFVAGPSASTRAILDLVGRVAPLSATVLILGESGTGKELIARSLHAASARRDGPFVALNCAAMPEALLESELFGHVRGAFTDAHAARAGLFAQANGGTLFLDEIGDLSLHLQPKLLRVLQDRVVRPVGGEKAIPCDVRIMAATNQDLELAVAQGSFRRDLFFRVNVIHVEVPPLRARGTDVLLLAQVFLEQQAARAGKPVGTLAPAVAERLLAYRWPGNVRELQNCIERAVALAARDRINLDDLPERIRRGEAPPSPGGPRAEALGLPLEEIERRHILQVLDAVRGNRTIAAQRLGLDRKTLYRKLQRYAASE
jgi:DNA-binding NtrC family response regulator